MDIISREQVRELAQVNHPRCVSLFIPTHRAGQEIRQDSIRLKNVLTQAETLLAKENVRKPDIDQLLEPARQLVSDEIFWRRQSDGLALFLAPGTVRKYRLPIAFDELAVVADRFHLKPLIPFLTNDGDFYLLALSQKQVRLFHGSRQTLNEVNVDGIPHSLAEALKYDDFEVSLQYHQGSSQKGEGRAGIFHGHGADDAGDRKENLLRYFQDIDRGLREMLAEETAPLLLAGVEYYFPIYQQANSYAHLLEEGLPGNPEHLDPHKLHEQAWARVEPIFTRKRKQALDELGAALSKKQASTEIEAILRTAAQGRVNSLLVERGRQVWGVFDPTTDRIEVHDQRQSADEDLLNIAALETFLNRGTVYGAEPGQLPTTSGAAAIYRY